MRTQLDTDAFPGFNRKVAVLFDHFPSAVSARRLDTKVIQGKWSRPERERGSTGFGEIIGSSAALRAVLEEVRQVADTDATVLVLGETGTGKELIARAVHTASGRSERQLVTINCAAMPANLIESELFGHERGAFTGATRKREGRFALADGGTLFLDEIGELPLDLQAKLLRVIQEGEFEPVGSSETRSVNVRLVAATHRDLREAVQAGRFREDLYYRLNVFPVRLPPLRERMDDIPLLVAAFAARFAQRIGRVIEPATEACISRLQAYSWPGNIRELQNVVERAVICSRNGRLEPDRCLPDVAPSSLPERASVEDELTARVLTVDELHQLEHENMVRALKRCAWRVAGETGAARLLNMNPSTLTSRMKVLGIRRGG